MLKCHFPKNFYDDKRPLFAKGVITLNPGLTVLIGCNGAGKTTMLHILNDFARKNKIPVIRYDNLKDGGHNAMDEAAWWGDYETVAMGFVASEGEAIKMNLGHYASKIGTFVRKHAEAKELFILFDAIDSGSSIDNIIEMKRDLFQIILENKPSRQDIYIVVTANSFEMAKNEDCIDITTLRHVNPRTYDRYSKIIQESRIRRDA